MNSSRQNRILRWKVAASVTDFVSAAFCALAIIMLFSLIVSLYGWLRVDLREVFRGITQNVTNAIIMEN